VAFEKPDGEPDGMRPFERGDLVEIKSPFSRTYGVITKILGEGMLKLHINDRLHEVQIHESKVKFPGEEHQCEVRNKYKALLKGLIE
jgi:hypothetical protein